MQLLEKKIHVLYLCTSQNHKNYKYKGKNTFSFYHLARCYFTKNSITRQYNVVLGQMVLG